MIDEALLTVVIPVFNTAQFLPRCIDSLINQVYKDIKIILVDDCSTDNSMDIIRKYADLYDNIEFFSTLSRKGAGHARNIGLKKVTTKYVTFLDSDDWIDSNVYQKTINLLEKNTQCDVAIFGIKTEYDSPFLSNIKCNYEYNNIIDHRYALTLLCKTINYDSIISAMLGNKIIKVDLLKHNNISFIHKHFEDVYFSYLLFYYSRYVIFIEGAYLHYYQHQNSIMHSFTEEYIKSIINIFYDLREFLNSQNCYVEYQNEYFSLFNKSIYSIMNMIFSTEQNCIIQKKYITYLFEGILKNFCVPEIIQNLDINLIKEIFYLR